jgi:hypothetical protein
MIIIVKIMRKIIGQVMRCPMVAGIGIKKPLMVVLY